jgi:hypothetical protein
VLAPADPGTEERASWCAAALAAAGAGVTTVRLVPGETSRAALAALLGALTRTDAAGGGTDDGTGDAGHAAQTALSGVLSLLTTDETPDPAFPRPPPA